MGSELVVSLPRSFPLRAVNYPRLLFVAVEGQVPVKVKPERVRVPPPIEVLVVRKVFYDVVPGRDPGLGLLKELFHLFMVDGMREVPRFQVRLARLSVHNNFVGLEVEVAVSDAVLLHVGRRNVRPGHLQKRNEQGPHEFRVGRIAVRGGLVTHGCCLVLLPFRC